MPAQIWAYPQGEQSTRGRWHNVPVQHADAVEYRRADLPPTEAECLRNEKMRGLVEAVKQCRDYRYDPHIGIKLNLMEEALAALEQEAGRE